jgi:hypothetical protein
LCCIFRPFSAFYTAFSDLTARARWCEFISVTIQLLHPQGKGMPICENVSLVSPSEHVLWTSSDSAFSWLFLFSLLRPRMSTFLWKSFGLYLFFRFNVIERLQYIILWVLDEFGCWIGDVEVRFCERCDGGERSDEALASIDSQNFCILSLISHIFMMTTVWVIYRQEIMNKIDVVR